MANGDLQRSVPGRIPRMAKEPRRPRKNVVLICDEYQHSPRSGENDPGGDERFFSLSRQARLVARVGHPVDQLAALGAAGGVVEDAAADVSDAHLPHPV